MFVWWPCDVCECSPRFILCIALYSFCHVLFVFFALLKLSRSLSSVRLFEDRVMSLSCVLSSFSETIIFACLCLMAWPIWIFKSRNSFRLHVSTSLLSGCLYHGGTITSQKVSNVPCFSLSFLLFTLMHSLSVCSTAFAFHILHLKFPSWLPICTLWSSFSRCLVLGC